MIALALSCCLAVQESSGTEDRGVFVTPQVPETATAAEAAAGRDRALAYLVENQNPDGSWASGAIEGVLDIGYAVSSFYDWQLGAHCLALLALLQAPSTPEREVALRAGVDWWLGTRMPKRGNDWDNDAIWAGLYGMVCGQALSEDSRFQGAEEAAVIAARRDAFLDLLVRNQVPTGGWAYYDDPIYSRRPKWATSFSTALVLPTMRRALELGVLDDPAVLRRGIRYVERCRLPNGAYEYDLRPVPRVPMGESINDVKGSLGRIQVCQWALTVCGSDQVDHAKLRTGLEEFFQHHRFLDIARMRPIPHEAYYANAGYFYFFGHYYAAEAIELLPEDEQESYHARLRPHILKTLREDGSCCDFLGQRYLVVSSTAYAALTLGLGL